MTVLKTRCVLPLAALLLLMSVVPIGAEVVKSISDCDQFFLQATPPQVPGILVDGIILNQTQYKLICQTFMNERRFVTLYDTASKIPVFSANKYRGGNGNRPDTPWKTEPQVFFLIIRNMTKYLESYVLATTNLENGNDDKNMRDDTNMTYIYQAGDYDYKDNQTFDRGHLFPSSYAFSENDKDSTFTLTNAVPQAATFNQGSWRRMENCIKCVMDKYCFNNSGVTEGFVVTGAQPSIRDTLSNRVNIPSMLWSAFCCYSQNVSKWLASAYWGDNVADQSQSENLQTKTLAELNTKLSSVGSGFETSWSKPAGWTHNHDYHSHSTSNKHDPNYCS
uniref:endonuclease domain-containing 1 protein-like n=1 Tax=Monopterus albus TaxID=43700 RepID=UPI0009B4E4AE|nr:endonuclease domain-containing 1 protein-like [Monopterus albus]